MTDVGPAVADVVILRSGEMFQTRRAWNENGTVNYYNIFYGFWQGGLYTILIETSNFVDFMELK
ncbi:MAG: hypothetical protein KFF68_07310, partial [Desulfosarcina sp.]|nr:hypothetical protein [Desulfosarcina sp.]